MSGENRVLDMLPFDVKTVKDFIKTVGEIKTMAILAPCFAAGPTSKRITDSTLRQMLWNIHHSLEKLKCEVPYDQLTHIDDIIRISKITKDVPTRTMTRHILGGFISLGAYMDNYSTTD